MHNEQQPVTTIPQAIEILAAAERAVALSGRNLSDIDHRRALAIRSALISGENTDADSLTLQLETARRDHERKTQDVLIAREILRAAEANEGLDRENKARVRVDKVLSEIETAAREADAAIANTLAALSRLDELERDAHRICRDRLRPVFGSAFIRSNSISKIREHFASLLTGNPTSRRLWASDAAAQATVRIREASDL
jgi:hypothetical protein